MFTKTAPWLTSEWSIVLPSPIFQPHICWESLTWLQCGIFQCHPRDYAWIP
jgi:hypothetical protein